MPKKQFTLSDVVALLSVLAVVAAMGIPQLFPSRSTPREASAVAHLRLILTMETLYASTRPGGGFGTMADLLEAGLLDASFEGGEKGGYVFEIAVLGKTGFSATATPIAPTTGAVRFQGDETGAIQSLPVGADSNRALPAGKLARAAQR